jgi:hypothetical protein
MTEAEWLAATYPGLIRSPAKLSLEGPLVTEQDWLVSENPLQLLDYVGVSLESRKALLVTAACFRRHWERLPEVCRDWARMAETAAEGRASRKDLDDAFEAIEEALNELGPPGEFVALLDMGWGMWTAEWPRLDEGEQDSAWLTERKAHAFLVRDVFGNPFRPAPTLAPSVLSWDSGTVPNLATAIYEERAFNRLPILADALEDAGCSDAAILGHCRGGGEHARGCWVVDLVLGKE